MHWSKKYCSDTDDTRMRFYNTKNVQFKFNFINNESVYYSLVMIDKVAFATLQTLALVQMFSVVKFEIIRLE